MPRRLIRAPIRSVFLPTRSFHAAIQLALAVLPAAGKTALDWAEPSTCGLTHGPMLGGLTSSSVRVWARTRGGQPFRVLCADNPALENAHVTPPLNPSPERDFTGWTEVSGLLPDTRYFYAVEIGGRLADTRRAGEPSSFRTLPATETHRRLDWNPRGLFNFSFAVGSCNWQFPGNHQARYGGEKDAVYATMLDRLRDRACFQIFTGDFIYEEAERPWKGRRAREVGADEWAAANGLAEPPALTRLADGITGVWEIFKLYLERGRHLAAFHCEFPVFAIFDDHEIYNDVLGAGHAGLRADARLPGLQGSPFAPENLRQRGNYHQHFRPFNQTHEGEVEERSVFRDPALRAWQDYLGWANPTPAGRRPIHFGEAALVADSDVLHDPSATILGQRQFDWLADGLRGSDADFVFIVSSVSFMIPHDNGEGAKGDDKDESWTAHAAERDRLLDLLATLDKPVFLLAGDIYNSMVVRITPKVWVPCRRSASKITTASPAR